MSDFTDLPKVIGLKQTMKQLKADNVLKVVVAEDTDEPLKKQIVDACEKGSVPVTFCKSKTVLGKASGIERGAAVVALLKD